MNKLLLMSVLGLGLGIGAMQAAEVVVRVAPPRAIVERRSERPSPRHVWIAGYHRWDGNAYAWEPGRWDVPPREHAVWIAPRWQHRHDGYVFVEGRWR
jgi:WXXGXW repeat (2 copies)